MHESVKTRGKFVLAVSFILVLAMFLWERKLGLSLSDEGYLWYGVQRVLVGDVPLRDFMAYEPGRYYWSAPWMVLRGNQGIVGVRMAIAAFEFLGLWVALHVMSRALPENRVRDQLLLVIGALTLLAWMVPRHKLFDISLCLFLIASLAWMVERPSRGRYVVVGVVVGLVTCFGRNHGLYGGVAGCGAIFWLSIRRGTGLGFIRGMWAYAQGLAVGLLPMLIMIALVPGFARAVADSVILLLAQGSTNLPLPVPWPWTFSLASMRGQAGLSGFLAGWYFLGLLSFGLISVAWCFRQRLAGRSVPAEIVACAMLSLPYAHFAFSRADISHLAQGIFPLLLGVCILTYRMQVAWKWIVTMGLLVTSVVATLSLHPGWVLRRATQPVKIYSYGDVLKVDTTTAAQIAQLRELAEAYVSDGGTFVTVPFSPGAYALLGRRSPMWELYPLFPRSVEFQEQEIARLQAASPQFILVQDDALDGRDLKFSRTHAVEFDYFARDFERSPRLGGSWYLFLPTTASPDAPGIH